MSDARTVYKIVSESQWREARIRGAFPGAGVDLASGYMHLSAGDQVADTAAKHFAGEDGLVLLAVDVARLGPALRWEPSRGGALFPHLYGELSADAVRWTEPLPLGGDGRHAFPELEP